MTGVKVNLYSDDKAYHKTVTLDFEDAEWERLLAYHAEAEKLRGTKFVREEMGGSINLTFNHKAGITSKSKSVDDEAVSTLLHRARPFLLNEEDTYFFKILKLLKRRTQPFKPLHIHLNAIKAGFELKRMANVQMLNIFGEIPSDFQTVMEWLNGHEYHRDKAKRENSIERLKLFGTDQDGRPTILFALVDMIQSILVLGDFIENLMRSKDRDFPITCPSDWFDAADRHEKIE